MNKSFADLLGKLGIERLNPMQREARKAILANEEVVLISPTGSGKTLAFVLPILETLKPKLNEVQAVIVVPARELAVQIEQVIRQMGSGFKVNAAYGGRSTRMDREELAHPPAILVATPGRLADHLRRKTFRTDHIKTLVLDEFDKSLEVGFDKEMIQILRGLPNLQRKVLTSATELDIIPDFVGITTPLTVNHSHERKTGLALKLVPATTRDKLETLIKLLLFTERQNGIVFCNYKGSIDFVGAALTEAGIEYSLFHGDLEQQDRERALIKLRNGTHRILLATDLAARGIDVPQLDFIVHYQLPNRLPEFTHRNGRTARMNDTGTAYILRFPEAPLYDYLTEDEIEVLDLPEEVPTPPESPWATLYVSGGRKDKISKGDLAGLFFKQGGLERGELGVIEVLADCAFVAVPRDKVGRLVGKLNNGRVKKRKVRVTQA